MTTQERLHAVIQLRRIMGDDPEDAPTIYTLTTYGRGETDHVRLWVIDDGQLTEITYYTAAAMGVKVSPRKGIARRGGGYSKALDTADTVWHHVYGRPLNQHLWTEL